MRAREKIIQDWDKHTGLGTNAVSGKPWGYQWGGETIFKQVEELGVWDNVESPVLEVACGGGKWTKIMLGMGYEVTAIDTSANALAKAREYIGDHPNLTLAPCDGAHLKFKRGSFGTVFIFDLLLHLPHCLVMQYFMEAKKVAKRSLVFNLPDLETDLGMAMFKQQVAAGQWDNLFGYGFMNYWTSGMIKVMLGAAGWQRMNVLGWVGARSIRDIMVVATP